MQDQDSMRTSEQATPTEPPQRGVPIPTTRPIATYILLGILIVIYVIQMVIDQTSETNQNWLLEFGVLWPYGVLHGEAYRLLTAMFLHANIAHIAFNGYALWIYGKLVESLFGHVRFLLIYFLGGLAGSVAQLLVLQGGLGASGAIFAIFAAYMVFLYQNRAAFGQRAVQGLRSLAFIALLNLGFGIFSQLYPGAERIGLAAHIGGFVAGGALAWFIGPRLALVHDPSAPQGQRVADTVTQRQMWIASGVVAAALIAGYLISLVILRKEYGI